jgi:hypothetical protein
MLSDHVIYRVSTAVVLRLSASDVMPVSLTRREDNTTRASDFYSFLLDAHLVIKPSAYSKWKFYSSNTKWDNIANVYKFRIFEICIQ